MLNREEVRRLLAEYKESENQQRGILSDEEVQRLFRTGVDDLKAYELIDKRYPKGRQGNLNEAGKALMTEMLKGKPEYRDIEPGELWSSEKVSRRMIKIAEKV